MEDCEGILQLQAGGLLTDRDQLASLGREIGRICRSCDCDPTGRDRTMTTMELVATVDIMDQGGSRIGGPG